MSYSAVGSFGFGQGESPEALCKPDPDGTQYSYNPFTQDCDPVTGPGAACPPDPDGTQYILNPATNKCVPVLGPGVLCLPDPDGTQYAYNPVTKKCELVTVPPPPPAEPAEMSMGTKVAIVGGIVAVGLLVAYA